MYVIFHLSMHLDISFGDITSRLQLTILFSSIILNGVMFVDPIKGHATSVCYLECVNGVSGSYEIQNYRNSSIAHSVSIYRLTMTNFPPPLPPSLPFLFRVNLTEKLKFFYTGPYCTNPYKFCGQSSVPILTIVHCYPIN